MKNAQIRRRRRVARLAEHQSGLCFYCDEPMILLDPKGVFSSQEGNEPDVASEDHFIARSLGGSNNTYNLVIAHRQCNSEKGRGQPEEHLVEKLQTLNGRRGLTAPDVPGSLSPSTFGKAQPALVYLCDLANIAPGGPGNRLRHHIASRLQKAILLLRELSVIERPELRNKVMERMTSEMLSNWKPLGDPYDNLIHNVVHTMRKRYLRARPELDESGQT